MLGEGRGESIVMERNLIFGSFVVEFGKVGVLSLFQGVSLAVYFVFHLGTMRVS